MATSGLLLALSAPGFGLWPLAWIALIPMFLWVRGQSDWKTIAWGGGIFGAVYHGLYCLWFWEIHPLTWLGFSTGQSLIITAAGWLIIVAGGALLHAGLALAFHRLIGYDNPWPSLLAFPALWVLGYALLNVSPLTLPWALLEYTQAPLYSMRVIATLVGGAGVTYGLVFHNVFWEAWLSGKLRHRSLELATGRLPPGLLLPLITPFLFLVGSLLPEPRLTTQWPVPVAVMQGNLPIDVIRSARLTHKVAARAYLDPVRTAPIPEGTLVVLPEEGAIPGWVWVERPESNPSLAAWQQLAQDKKFYVMTGLSLRDERPYNAVGLIDPHGRVQFYRKRKLVPFGESTPFGLGDALSAWLKQVGVQYSTPFASGPPAHPMQAGRLAIAPLVCFELVDSDPFSRGLAGEARRAGAHLLVNVSNLGWFHDHPLMAAQFLAIAQMRAAENNRPLVLAANSGPSAILSATGQVMARLPARSPRGTSPHLIFYDGHRSRTISY